MAMAKAQALIPSSSLHFFCTPPLPLPARLNSPLPIPRSSVFGAVSGRVCLRRCSLEGRPTPEPPLRHSVAGPSDLARLEAYTEIFKSEILLVHALLEEEDGAEEDLILIYKGVSSSLLRPTAFDMTESVLPSSAVITSIDRVREPFDPNNPNYIQKSLSWDEFEAISESKGI